jgi:RNA polymerase sigma factor (sigma-70 family)
MAGHGEGTCGMGDITMRLQERIDALNAGEADAREGLLAHAADRLRALVARIFQADFARLKKQEQTDDVFGELYLRLHRRLDGQRYDNVAHFMRWSACEIRFLLVDLIRRHYGRGHRPTIMTRNDTAEDASSYCPLDPAEETHDPARMLFWQAFHEAVERLPEVEREVVDLLWFQELPQLQVAQLLGVSVGTVKQRWRNARINLQRELPGGGATNWQSATS